MFALAALSFFIGFLVRVVDLKEDEGLKLPRMAAIVFGFTYGILIGFVFVAWPQTLALIGIFIALLLTRKIDAPGHFAGLAGLAAAFAFMGAPPLDVWPLVPIGMFLAAGVIDEAADWFQERRRMDRRISLLLYIRPFSEATAIAYFVATGFWEVWLALLSFDVAFIAFDLAWKRGRTKTH